MVFLDPDGFLGDAVVGPGDALCEESAPLRIGEGDLVHRFELGAEVGDELRLGGDR